MGGADKALVPCCGRPLLSWVIERAAPQVDEILVSANGDPARFAAFGFPVLADRIGGHLGPVAGILSGLAWMKAYRPEAQWLATFACDTPFFPHDLVTRLAAKAEDTRSLVGVAASGGRQHGVFAVWSARIVETT